jgi:hypothetical protein
MTSSPRQPRPAIRSTLARIWRPLAAGAVSGLVFGLAIGYLASPEGLAGVGVFLPFGVLVLLVLGLLVLAAVRRSPDPVLAVVSVIAFVQVGAMIAPDAPGSRQIRSGTGSGGTRDDPSALWSGPVTCEWLKEYDHTVQIVKGFDVPVSDPAVLAANNASGIRIVALRLPPTGGWVGVSQPHTSAIVDTRVEGHRPGTAWPDLGLADLDGLASDARSGTAIVAGAGVVLNWSCNEEP